MTFYDPADETIELIKDGSTTQVTLANLQDYIDLVLDSTFNTSIQRQLAAFRKGFSTVLPLEALRIFRTEDELELLICGEGNDDAEWKNGQRLQEVIVTAHGYHAKSRAFQDFVRYLTEMDSQMRAPFLRFITGSPRLPIGGFSGLEPRLTVVLKKPLNK